MRKYIIAIAIIAVATILLVLPSQGNVAQAGPPGSATVAFGQDTGSQSAGFHVATMSPIFPGTGLFHET